MGQKLFLDFLCKVIYCLVRQKITVTSVTKLATDKQIHKGSFLKRKTQQKSVREGRLPLGAEICREKHTVSKRIDL